MNAMQIPADIVSRTLMLTATLLLTVVLLEVAGIMVGSTSGDRVTEDETISLPEVSPDASIASKHPPIGNFREILQRPLFEEARRPVQDAGAAGNNVSAESLRKRWRLSGIILDEENIAIIESVQPGKTQSLIAGQSLDGWRVQEINAMEVVLILGTEAVRFALHKESVNSPTAARGRIKQIWKPSEQ